MGFLRKLAEDIVGTEESEKRKLEATKKKLAKLELQKQVAQKEKEIRELNKDKGGIW